MAPMSPPTEAAGQARRRRGRSALPATARQIAAPMPSRSHNRSSVHAPPSQREATISTSPPSAAAAACSGVSYREIDATSRASAARSTWSARPKLWITLATEFPVCCRWATTEPSSLVRRLSRRYMTTSQRHPCGSTPATRHQSCACTFWRIRGGRNGVTSANATDQGQMCLRTAEVRLAARESEGRWAPARRNRRQRFSRENSRDPSREFSTPGRIVAITVPPV
jgi:hypothetical protein